jgi:hypothetical protein
MVDVWVDVGDGAAGRQRLSREKMGLERGVSKV